MVMMREDKTHKGEADKKIEDEIEDEYGVVVPVRPLSGCLLVRRMFWLTSPMLAKRAVFSALLAKLKSLYFAINMRCKLTAPEAAFPA
jgi:hypothetical protein